MLTNNADVEALEGRTFVFSSGLASDASRGWADYIEPAQLKLYLNR